MYVDVLIVCLITLVGVRPETCRTPNNKEGECIPLTKCESLLTALLNRQVSDTYIEQLNCGGTILRPNICCTAYTSVYGNCKMPDNRVGECKPLYGCNEILTALTNNYISPDFVEQLHCGGTITRPYICCAPITQPTRKPIRNRYPVNETAGVCGFQHADSYFHSANETIITEYPWLARIGYRRDGEDYYEYRCAGSLINRNYVLTAAQCLQGNLIPSSVRLGEYHSLNQTDCMFYSDIDANECNDVEDYRVERYIVHPEYNTSKEGGNHDIALIKLDREVDYTDYIRPVCLPHSDIPRPQGADELTISGWGWLTNSNNVYVRSQFKQKANLVAQSSTSCRGKSGIYKPVQDGQGCSRYDRSKVCLYENGGPIVFSEKYRWYQEGIAVDGRKNCIEHTHLEINLVYTKVIDYIGWIKETVGVI